MHCCKLLRVVALSHHLNCPKVFAAMVKHPCQNPNRAKINTGVYLFRLDAAPDPSFCAFVFCVVFFLGGGGQGGKV